MPIQNPQEIVNRCKGGDLSAFRALMERYQGQAFALAFRMVCSEEDAEDIVQEAFIRIWKNAARYDQAVKFTTWLYTIVTNLCYDTLRARKRRPLPATTCEGNEALLAAAASLDDDPETAYANRELATLIERMTEHLPPTQRIVFVLRDMQDVSIREACEITGLSESSVKTNLVYARRSIRQQLERYEKGKEEADDDDVQKIP